ncbi:type II secretion system minor pseudopilin GspI [Novilysobacter erysipheiresistens]|uniref:Type II secretion system protein I n=1 Tax=Novilysobacter erysipheiresistens TaxID=1749332 RepID=A0ABU7YUX4_9GAMM
MRRADRRARGFSLIEMLVAMAVFSLVALALLNLAGENTRTAVVIEERVLAGVVADNRAVEAMLSTPAELAAQSSGTESVGDRDWGWTRTVSPTDMDAIVRVDVTVMPTGEDRVVAEASVFRGVE